MGDGIRCSRCEQTLEPEAFAPSHQRDGDWCRACRTEYMRLYREAHYQPTPRISTAKRERKPRVLVTHGGKPSGPRWRRLQEQVWATETHCGFCGYLVDQSLHHNHPMARCVDHITPIAHGGAMYERDNVRLAHRSCNSRAGASLKTEQLALTRAALWIGSNL